MDQHALEQTLAGKRAYLQSFMEVISPLLRRRESAGILCLKLLSPAGCSRPCIVHVLAGILGWPHVAEFADPGRHRSLAGAGIGRGMGRLYEELIPGL